MKIIENQYIQLLSELLFNSNNKEDRTGVGTKSIFGVQLEHDMRTGFPMLVNKKMYFNSVASELLWILNGRTDIEYLHENGVTYWDADYHRSGRTDGTLGPVYGKQWRDFNGTDQLKDLLIEIKRNPHSRRLIVNAWAPHEINDMALPPCHYSFQIYINNGIIDLLWVQRSADVFLGLPYDIAMYALLLELLCVRSSLTPGKLICQLGDCHLYLNHINAAQEYIAKSNYVNPDYLPELVLHEGIYLKSNGEVFIPNKKDFFLYNYNPINKITAKLNVG